MAQHIGFGFEVEKYKKGTIAAVITPKLRFDFLTNKIRRAVFGTKIRFVRAGRWRRYDTQIIR